MPINSKLALKRAILAALAGIVLPVGAQAAGYTRVQGTDSFSNGAITFTLLSNLGAPATGTQSLDGFTPATKATGVSYTRTHAVGSTATEVPFVNLWAGGATVTKDTASAPTTFLGTAYEGGYVSTNNSTGWQGPIGNVGAVVGFTAGQVPNTRYAGLLWGSVEAGNTLGLMNSNGTAFLGTIQGSDILAAASALGISGYNGSYYVAVTTANAFSAMTMQTVANTKFEMAVLQHAGTVVTPTPTPLGSNNGGPGSPGALPEAPAPVVGSTPLGGLLAFGLLGMLGLRRRRAEGAVAA